jgi:preprotein translocase subunit SecF
VTPSTPPSTGAEQQLGAEKAIILKALQSFDDPADVTSKTDLNNVGRDSLRDKLADADPLGLVASSGQTAATADYARYANLIIDYRGQQGGLINQISDLKNISGLPQGVVEKLPAKFYAGTAVMLSAEVVGPQIGQELRGRAIYVVLASFVGILIYIAFRFEWIYGVAAVIAVFHDLLVTLGIFSLLQKEISLNVVAALLTLAGYSVNDTIVVFDRIRENLRLRRRDDLTTIVNDSINQTLSRTIITSGLTFMTVFCLWVFGGPVLDGFALALVIGIIIGTYSSIAIASPLMVWWKQWQELRARARRQSEAGRRTEARRKVVAN